jgi:hypothetical protein
MTAGLDDADRARLRRQGVAPLTHRARARAVRHRARRGASRCSSPSRSTPRRCAPARARAAAALFRGPRPRPRPPRRDRLARAAPRRRAGVGAHGGRARAGALPRAAALGHAGADAVDPARRSRTSGFDSLAAVELRNRLSQAAACAAGDARVRPPDAGRGRGVPVPARRAGAERDAPARAARPAARRADRDRRA